MRILGWDYLIESFKSLSCAAEGHEFPPEAKQGIPGIAFIITGEWIFAFSQDTWFLEETGGPG